MSNAVVFERVNDAVVKIILNRPYALNSINHELLDGLVSALKSSQAARVIILEGAGDRAFCAGEDLKQSLVQKPASPEDLDRALHKLQAITRLTASAKPLIIAAVQGFAIGGGAEIALCADFVIGGPDARFRFPEARIGHAVTNGISARLPHLVGLLRAKEILLTGRWIKADEALNIGLLTEIAEDPKKRALEFATQLAEAPAAALAASKTTLEQATFPSFEECLAHEVRVASHCFAQQDAEKTFEDFAARKRRGSPSRTINWAWSHAVKNFPSNVFLRFGGRDVTFQDFDALVARLAGGLREVGVAQGDRALVMMRNSVEMTALWIASNRLGATWIPINTEIRSVTLRGVVQSAGPKVVVVDSELWPELEQLKVVSPSVVYVNGNIASGSGVKALSTLVGAHSTVDTPVEVAPDATAAFLYTSGTTGKSKPCMLSHEYFQVQADAIIDSYGLRGDDVLYCPFPLFHIDATALTVMPAIRLGATAALSVRFSASRFWDEIRDSKATVYNFMGATLALTYKQPPKPSDRDHNVRLAWGVPLPNFAHEYAQRFGHRIATLYGSVEAGVPIFENIRQPPVSGSCGRLREGYQACIVGNKGETLPANSPGHLLLKSKNPNSFFKGYFEDAKSTSSVLSGGWLRTGDLAKMDKKGNVYFVGRIKDVIRRRGENINASEVEEEFLQHPDVMAVAAYGIPSRLGAGTEEDVKVAVQKRPGSVLTEQDLWTWARKHMARFQVPSVVQLVDRLDQTPTGKIDKRKLSVEGGQRFDIRISKL